MTDTLHSVDSAELRALLGRIWQAAGMAADDAHLLADSLVDADLRGVHSHGVLRVPEYVHKLTTAGVDPRGRPRVVREFGACLVVDGGNSMGVVGATFAMRQAIARAATTGVAVAAVRGSNHCGAMGYYARMALPAGMIGIATTNALPTMAPWGGAERILGINPLAVAVPAADEPAIVYDAAFSASSHGKLRVYQQQGRPLPEGWALDRAGQPTTDPALAIAGLLMPIGAFKGAGLAMIMGILSSILSGAAYGAELGSMETGPTAGRDGHCFAALSVAAFEDPAVFLARVDAAIRQVRTSRRAPGVSRLYAPGELEHDTQQQYLAGGIPLNPVILADLARTTRALGIYPSPYGWLPPA
jgi:LDH2 family malate/lactate/ureidoglycolate dehydrogenase